MKIFISVIIILTVALSQISAQKTLTFVQNNETDTMTLQYYTGQFASQSFGTKKYTETNLSTRFAGAVDLPVSKNIGFFAFGFADLGLVNKVSRFEKSDGNIIGGAYAWKSYVRTGKHYLEGGRIPSPFAKNFRPFVCTLDASFEFISQQQYTGLSEFGINYEFNDWIIAGVGYSFQSQLAQLVVRPYVGKITTLKLGVSVVQYTNDANTDAALKDEFGGFAEWSLNTGDGALQIFWTNKRYASNFWCQFPKVMIYADIHSNDNLIDVTSVLDDAWESTSYIDIGILWKAEKNGWRADFGPSIAYQESSSYEGDDWQLRFNFRWGLVPE